MVGREEGYEAGEGEGWSKRGKLEREREVRWVRRGAWWRMVDHAVDCVECIMP